MQNGYAINGAWPQNQQHDQVNGPAYKKAKMNNGMITTKYTQIAPYASQMAQSQPYAWPQPVPGYNAAAYYGAYGQGNMAAYAQHQQAAYAAYQQYPMQYYQQPQYPQAGSVSAPFLSAVIPPVWPTQVSSSQVTTQAIPGAYRGHVLNRNNSIDITTPATKPNGYPDELDESHEDYCEFTRPCYYASRESEVVKELSIGIVQGRTAVRSNHALPATWDEANELALIPNPGDRYDPDKCVSDYHREDSKGEELNTVRSSSTWQDIKDDIIFAHLPRETLDLVDLLRLKNGWRCRLDRTWMETRPDYSRPSIQAEVTAQRRKSALSNAETRKRGFDQVDNMPEHDTTDRGVTSSTMDIEVQPHASQTRTSQSTAASYAQRSATQEEILARLGVTGPPKPVQYQLLSNTSTAATANAPSTQDIGHQMLRPIPEEHSIEREPNGKSTPGGLDDIQLGDQPAISIDDLPVIPNESRWTRLARQYQLANKRSHDETEDGPPQDNTTSAELAGKRRK